MAWLEAKDFLENLITGGISAGVAKTLVAPLDRIKILLQLQHTLEGLGGTDKGAKQISRYVLKEQVFLGVYRLFCILARKLD